MNTSSGGVFGTCSECYSVTQTFILLIYSDNALYMLYEWVLCELQVVRSAPLRQCCCCVATVTSVLGVRTCAISTKIDKQL
jgi:hypothetical protein